MGEAQPVIEKAMHALGVEIRAGVNVVAISASGVELEGGEAIAASTVVWCARIHASPLANEFPVKLHRQSRIRVDEYLRIKGVPDAFAAGDCATFAFDGKNDCIMSCQYGRAMGRYCGYNVAADLLGEPMEPLRIDYCITCADLGPWGAVYTEGRERKLATQGEQNKRTKMLINRKRKFTRRVDGIGTARHERLPAILVRLPTAGSRRGWRTRPDPEACDKQHASCYALRYDYVELQHGHHQRQHFED